MMKHLIHLLIATIFLLSCNEKKTGSQPVEPLRWEEIRESAESTNVTLMMWQGDPFINKYMSEFIVPSVRDQFGIELNIVNGQGSQIVSTLMAEKDAGVSESEIDMMWINGETFFQLRQIGALHGPFVSQLPNNQFIDWKNPFIANDFQQPVEGFECPWGNVQLALIYNSDKVNDPPQNPNEWRSWVREHPGKFTLSNDFTGMTLLKSWLIYFAGGDAIRGEYDDDLYNKYGKELWDFINDIKPYLWNEGSTFPANIARMHQLYSNGEIWFTMSNNDAEVDNKIAQGLFEDHSRAYVPQSGTIQNSHYMGIADQSPNKAGAMVVINFLISPEAQWRKMQPSVWGDGTILNVNSLSAEWQKKFQNIPGRKYAPERKEISKKALSEPAPEYMIRIFEDFRKKVIEGS